MIKTAALAISLIFCMSQPQTIAQKSSECKVLMKSISGQYEGDCRKGMADGMGKATGTDSYEGEFNKGLPDGEGKYTWSNGDVFIGTFRKGRKEGDGKLIYNQPKDGDSVLTGFWKNDEYFGLYESPFKVLSKTSPINRVLVRKLADSPNDILIIGEIEMLREKGLNSLYFNGSGFEKVKFPFTVDMEGSHANVPCSFKVIIYEPGRWEIKLNFD